MKVIVCVLLFVFTLVIGSVFGTRHSDIVSAGFTDNKKLELDAAPLLNPVAPDSTANRVPQVGHLPILIEPSGEINTKAAELIHEQHGLGTLVITLVDESQFPIASESISIFPLHQIEEKSFGLTDHNGQATFQSVIAGSYLYTVSTNNRPDLTATTPVQITTGKMSAITVIVRGINASIKGIVVDRAGAAITDLQVTAKIHHRQTSNKAGTLRRHSPASAKTDSEGMFLITNLQAGNYEITTEETERYISTTAVLRTGAKQEELVVGEYRARWITGSVTDIAGRPLSGVSVLPPPGSSDPFETDAQGRYVLALDETNLIGRRYLRFLFDGYHESRVALGDNIFKQEGPLEINTTLEELQTGITFTGGLTDEYGTAIEGERIQLHSKSRFSTFSTISDANGNFEFKGVIASDDYQIWVRPKGPYGDLYQSSVSLTENQQSLDFVLPDLGTGTVHGRLLDDQYNPVSTFNFWLRSANAKSKALSVSTDLDGNFTVEQVPAGLLTLGTISRPQLTITDIQLLSGEVKYLEIVIRESNGAITGSVQ